MKLLSIADLKTRWTYTKAGIHKLTKNKDFPQLFAIVSNGKIKIYQEADIEAYEQDKPWLFNEEQKKRRQRLYGLLNLAKANQKEQVSILQHAFSSKAKDWVIK